MKKLLSISLVIISVLSFSSCSNQKKISFQITETYRVTSSNGSVSILSVDLPVSYGYQTIGAIKVENTHSYSFEEKNGYRTLHAILRGSGKEEVVIIEYDVTLQRGNCTWREENRGEYLDPEQFVDSDNQSIVELANTLKANGDKFNTAKNIFRYTVKNVKYDSSDKINQKTLKASEVLKNKKGVCQDYANLMTALLRSSGISAKSISGLTLNRVRLKKSSNWSSPALSHAWVEFCIDGEWYIADPTWGNRYFIYSDGYHLSYGSQIANLDSHNRETNNNEGFTTVGEMTAPIKFKVQSEDAKARVIPRVDIIRQ